MGGGAMRWAKSYSIIDHEVLHGGYFQKLSVEALALYLFLVVVADREGKSYYAEKSVADILRLSPEKYCAALSELFRYGLIDFRRPFFWVKNLSLAVPRVEKATKGSENRRQHLLRQLEAIKDV